MRLLVAILAALFFGLAAIASLGYVQDGVTVTGSHGNVTSMGPYKNCVACHATTTAMRKTFYRSYTSWNPRWAVRTTVGLRPYTSFFIGFAQGPDNPAPRICLACHNATMARLSVYTSARYRRRANPIDSASHIQQTYSPKRSVVVFPTATPLFGYSIVNGQAVTGLPAVKVWDTTIKQQPKIRYGKGSNLCMDCHWPHTSNKTNYLR